MSTMIVRLGGREYRIARDAEGGLRPEGGTANVPITRVEPDVFAVLLNGRVHRVVAAKEGDDPVVLLEGMLVTAAVETERRRLLREHAGIAAPDTARLEVHAPMPALVIRVHVRDGDAVTHGQPLFVLEAMKMENEITSHRSGTVERVMVAPGRAVEKGELLLVFGAEEPQELPGTAK